MSKSHVGTTDTTAAQLGWLVSLQPLHTPPWYLHRSAP